MPVLILHWPDFTITCNYFKPPFFFRQSFVSSRFCFPQFSFRTFSVLFLCSIQDFVTFHFFSSVFEAFDWPHSGSWAVALRNLFAKSWSPSFTTAISLIKTPLMLYESVLLPRPLILTSQNIERVTCPPQYKVHSLITVRVNNLSYLFVALLSHS